MKRALIMAIMIAVLGAALPYAPVDFLKPPIERALERGFGTAGPDRCFADPVFRPWRVP